MKRFILDSNVVSEPRPDPAVLAWIETAAEWYLPSPVVAEIQEGAQAVTSESRRDEINSRLETYSTLMLDWDAGTSRVWGSLKHSPEVRRQPQALWDSLIDAIAVRFECVVATRNGDDFRHASTFNPWDGSERIRA